MRNTHEGRLHSASYNAELQVRSTLCPPYLPYPTIHLWCFPLPPLQLGNLRWAMIDILRNPPPGFDDVVRGHFRVLRRRIMSTAMRWVDQAAAAGEAMQKRMDAAVCELHTLLAAL